MQFYQLKVSYETQTIEEAKPAEEICKATVNADISHTIKTQDFEGEVQNIAIDEIERGDAQAVFSTWLYSIARSSFGFVTMEDLNAHTNLLRNVFDTITYNKDNTVYFSSKFDHALIKSSIRKSFCDKRDFITSEELIPHEAKLLNIANFTAIVNTDYHSDYYPNQDIVKKIIMDDNGELKINEKDMLAIEALEAAEQYDLAKQLKNKYISHPAKDRSFHYIPYKTGSGFEWTFIDEILVYDDVERLGLEVYYNGDRASTEFKIRCYKIGGSRWQYIGMYTPDFLIIKRKDGAIHKAVIVETKGAGYAADFADKRAFMETEFTVQNNKAFGYRRFDYLYLEDSLSEAERIKKTHRAITAFFKEGE
jgi:hypothetical protein